MNPTHDEQGSHPDETRVVPVRMQISAWWLVIKALKKSPDAGNYLVAAAIQGIEDTLGAVKAPVTPDE